MRGRLVAGYPEERRSQPHRGGSVKPHNDWFFFNIIAGETENSDDQLYRGYASVSEKDQASETSEFQLKLEIDHRPVETALALWFDSNA